MCCAFETTEFSSHVVNDAAFIVCSANVQKIQCIYHWIGTFELLLCTTKHSLVTIFSDCCVSIHSADYYRAANEFHSKKKKLYKTIDGFILLKQQISVYKQRIYASPKSTNVLLLMIAVSCLMCVLDFCFVLLFGCLVILFTVCDYAFCHIA